VNIRKCRFLVDNLLFFVAINRYVALIMEGVKGIPLSWKKYTFPGVLLLVIVLILVLYRRLGGGSVMVLHEALTGFGDSGDSGWSHAESDDNSRRDEHESPDGHYHHHSARSHVHDKEVHFVLHESALGAPEFIGRNDRKATFIDFDPAGTFLNAPGHAVAEIFRADNYKEKNIAIGLAITTREQEVAKETLAKDLPFYTVFVFHSLLVLLTFEQQSCLLSVLCYNVIAISEYE